MEWGNRVRRLLIYLEDFLKALWRILAYVYVTVWGYLQLRVPMFRALVKRHVQNPSTVIVDLALFALAVYLAFGVTGYALIYPRQSESRSAELLSMVYPFPAGRVDQSYIWSHRFLERLRFLNTFNAQAPQDVGTRPPTNSELRTRVLEGLIEDKVVYLEARKRGLRVTREELETAFDKQGKPEEIAPKIQQLYGMTIVQFKEIIAERVLKEKVKDAVLAKIRVRHILTLDLPSAQEAKRQVDSGRDFGEAAKEFSQDAKTAPGGGDLGFWRKGELAVPLSPLFEETANGLVVNQVSGLIETQFGFHVIQLTERIGDNAQTYDEWYRETLKNYRVKKYVKP